MAVLPRSFYDRPALEVAMDLLGHELVWRGGGKAGEAIGGLIVEVEAYGGADDPASHAFRGLTARNRTMFGPPGHAYVYFTYGMHHCVNVVTGPEGDPGAVLVRALEPRTHPALWRERRPDLDLARAASGPGRVCRALGLSRVHDGLDLTGSPLVIRPRERPGPLALRTGTRVGIRQALERKWRLWLADSPAVSRVRGAGDGVPSGRPKRG